MKSTIAIACTLAFASAQTIITTNNECWKGEGGSYLGECSSVYFLTCDEY